MTGRRIGPWTALVVGIALALGALPALRAWWWFRESNPVRRGAALAARAGCFSCHGPQGAKGLPDPALGEQVPAWDGGVPMMYVAGEQEVREYILDGVSKRRARSESARSERERAAIRMPGFRGFLSAREVDDLVAYFMAASRMEAIADEAASRGRAIVVRLRCESCHGVGGSGGVSNAGSLKGYVPGWLGPDFEELARDDGEMHQWILDGGIDRLARSRLATHFLARQRLQMPAYRKGLTPEETDAVVAYIKWLRRRH